LLVVTLLSVNANVTTNSSGHPSAVSGAAAACASAANATYDAMNKTSAIANALDSSLYSGGVVSYHNPTFGSIFQIDNLSAPYPTCTEQVQSFNVVFALHTSDGRWAGNLVITENQALTVIGSDYQTAYGSATNSTCDCWSGYEVQTSSSSPAQIWVAATDFTQPTPSYPSTGCKDSGVCTMATWVGLTDGSQASSGYMAQDGTAAVCSGSSCTPSYFAWYQLLGASSSWTQCDSTHGGAVTISPGHTVYLQTEDEAYYGGSSTEYDFYIFDSNSQTSWHL
jgi:hypothetical protein